jgi:hypothetical protein
VVLFYSYPWLLVKAQKSKLDSDLGIVEPIFQTTHLKVEKNPIILQSKQFKSFLFQNQDHSALSNSS